MQISSSDHSVFLKIVYYGPGLSGKTTNLETLHRLTDPEGQQPLVSLKTEQDRTLFFDLLPFDLGRISGMDVRFKLYTVPGQIQYDTTRKQVLSGADGVVFVADSQASQLQENVRMIRYLKNNLLANAIDPAKIPLVFQWNKRDLPALTSPDELRRELCWREGPCYESVATDGRGVIETLRAIMLLSLNTVASGRGLLAGKIVHSEAEARVDKALAEARGQRDAGLGRTEGDRARIDHVLCSPARSGTSDADDGRTILGLDELLSGAVQASVQMSEQLAGTAAREEVIRERWIREKKALSRMIQIARIATEPGSIHKIALVSLLAGLGLHRGSALALTTADQPLCELAVAGHRRDPLNAVQSPGIGSVATGLGGRPQPFLVESIADELMFGQPRQELADLRSVLALPVDGAAHGRSLLLAYAGTRDRELCAEDAELGSLIVSIAELALRSLTAASTPCRA
jgi:mutual gliding-motility protein MglA